jgi:hypothetical protein
MCVCVCLCVCVCVCVCVTPLCDTILDQGFKVAINASDVKRVADEGDIAMNSTEPRRFLETLITIIEFRRTPVEFREALLQHSLLAECRLQLSAAGHSTELDTGAKVFVESRHVLPTLEHLRSQGVLLNGSLTLLSDFKPRHVIVSETYISAVRVVLDALPKRLNINEKYICFFKVSLKSILAAFAYTLPCALDTDTDTDSSEVR